MTSEPTKADYDLVASFEAIRKQNPNAQAPVEVTSAVNRILVQQARIRQASSSVVEERIHNTG
jgi:hypothetical protein